jgi:hypothetical protein
MRIGDIIVHNNETDTTSINVDSWKLSKLEFIQKYDCYIVMNIRYPTKGSHIGCENKRLSTGDGMHETPKEEDQQVFVVYGDRRFAGWKDSSQFNGNYELFGNIFN